MNKETAYLKGKNKPPNEAPPLCACGCGRPVSWHYVKKQWNAFIHNHAPRRPWRLTPLKRERAGPPPDCACGCGKKVGWRTGHRCWNTYLQGHGCIGKPSPRRIEHGEPPLCACGCGRPVKLWDGFWRTYAARGCGRKGIRHTEGTIEILRQKAIERLRNGFPTKSTSIELMVADALVVLGLDYLPQYRIGRFAVDFYVPALALAIEVQGDYFHANPKKYAGKPLNKLQIRGQQRDERKRAFFATHPEIHYAELWEMDIRTDPLACVSVAADKYR